MTVQAPTTVDETIVVRVWIEPHDDQPRARLTDLGSNRELTARGFGEIERCFSDLLRSLPDPG